VVWCAPESSSHACCDGALAPSFSRLRTRRGTMTRMDLGLRDRVYLVTGGSRGLGFAGAQALVDEGARVMLSAPHEATATTAAARLTQGGAGGQAAWTVADNADPGTPAQLIAAARER
jgi:3-oxoacyl-[acyl-carrier protein] reductase